LLQIILRELHFILMHPFRFMGIHCI